MPGPSVPRSPAARGRSELLHRLRHRAHQLDGRRANRLDRSTAADANVDTRFKHRQRAFGMAGSVSLSVGPGSVGPD